MEIKLQYGRHGLMVDLPDNVEIIRSRYAPGVINEAMALRSAMYAPLASPPLAELVKPGEKVVITHSDITRATPNDRILPVILEELEASGIKRQDINLLNALGTHRAQTEDELRSLLGSSIVENYHCIQHDAFNDSLLVTLGVTSLGNPVRINRHYLDADIRILTGFIEPHFFAGFSGGPKGVLPALAGAESVLSNHSHRMIAHPAATWGVTEGNSIWEEMKEVALLTQPTFLLNVTLNTDQQITGVFAGDMIAAHSQGVQFVRQNAMVAVDEPYDIVITTNSGYPLDQNLYQSVKGMSAGKEIVRKGGAILIATACEDGLPDHGEYAKLLREASSPQAVLDMISKPGFSCADQWQVQIQAQIQQHADVYVFSHGLTKEQIEAAMFSHCTGISSKVVELKEIYGHRICVLPEGPQTIAYLQ